MERLMVPRRGSNHWVESPDGAFVAWETGLSWTSLPVQHTTAALSLLAYTCQNSEVGHRQEQGSAGSALARVQTFQ